MVRLREVVGDDINISQASEMILNVYIGDEIHNSGVFVKFC